jgi:hypothetical protein
MVQSKMAAGKSLRKIHANMERWTMDDELNVLN